jgi:glycosyltransferase involved in cell wall biosynthesis
LSLASTRYSRKLAVVRLEELLARARLDRRAVGWPGGKDRNVVVAGHDLKFIRPMADHLDQHSDTRIIVDHWRGHGRHEAVTSCQSLREADVILCEWMLGNAVWYSHNKRPDQRLVVRFHRMELETDYPAKVDLDAVDAVIFVGNEIARQAQRKFGIPPQKSTVIPNAVDCAAFARSKEHGYEYTIGMVGALPRLKRLDLCVELLRRLRVTDPRFRLCIKGKAPWELPWLWRREEEREYFERVLRDLADDTDLRAAVVFDDADPAVAEWFRKVGWVVSTSDLESFHLAVAEGMSSGAVPLVRTWRGAAEIYDRSWLHDDVASMARAVTETMATGSHRDLAARAQAEAARFDLPGVAAAIAAVLADRRPQVAPGPLCAAGGSA